MLSTDVVARSIYALIDPRSKRVKYVGQTVSPVPVRVKQHVALARRGGSTRKNEWLRELDLLDLAPEVEVLEVGTWAQEDCNDREAYWIACFRSFFDDELTNVHSRGAGRIGSSFTEARRAEQSRKLSAHLAKPEAREQRRQAMLQRYEKNPEAKQSDTAAMRAYFKDPENNNWRIEHLKALYDLEPERRKVIGDSSRARWADPNYKARKTLRSAEYRAKRSAIAKEACKKPERIEQLSRQGKAVSSRRVKCDVCGHEGKLPSFGFHHMKKLGHQGFSYLSSDGGGE